VNVWCSLMHKGLIRPFFPELAVTRALYLDMLELYVLSWLTPQTVFQQDGALPHYSHLNHTMPGGWIGRGTPIVWPPRLPYLTSLDFFLCGYIKNFVDPVKQIIFSS
jgi:hypothetical protein